MSEAQDPASMPACVVIDCNEWIRLKWLGSPVGLTFVSTMKRDPTIHLAIPEVLDSELNKHRADDARKLLSRLTGVVDEINIVTGSRTSAGVVTLTEEAIDVAIHERLSAVGRQTLYPEMDIEQARRALRRVNEETAPNGPKNQQMKDSLLWEACLSLATDYRVFFVTGDKAFYAGHDAAKGLAANLAAEAPVQQGRLRVFSTLEDAMRAFAPGTAVSTDEIVDIRIAGLIATRAEKALRRSPTATDLRPETALRGVVPRYLRTNVSHVFAASFTAFFTVNKGIEDALRGEAAVTGQCQLDTRQPSIDAVDIQTIHWTLTGPDGRVIKMREVPDSVGPPDTDQAGVSASPDDA